MLQPTVRNVEVVDKRELRGLEACMWHREQSCQEP
jgi:hypothetical protein